jgi:hypothetical protein
MCQSTTLLRCSAASVLTAGPDLGVASLTFQAFYEAKYGEAAWEALDKIPKEEWMAYLMWYRCAGQAYL